MNKTIIIIVAIAVVVLSGYFLFRGSNQSTPAAQPSNQQTITPLVSEPMVKQEPSPQSSIGQPQAAVAKVVTYTDSGFSPSKLVIKKGDTVIFKNTASDDMRVASNPHPIHNGYPTTGGCVSSTFDSCSNIVPGKSWSFKFDIAGTWGFHNHLNPGEGGTIVVQ